MSKKVKVIKKNIPIIAYQADEEKYIKTLEGVMHAKKGDWILTGIDGEQWPVKKEIFEKTYNIIEELDN